MPAPELPQPGKLPLAIFATMVLLLTTAYVIITSIENKSQVALQEDLKKQRDADREATALLKSIKQEQDVTNANQIVNTRGLWVAHKDDASQTLTLLQQLTSIHQRNLQNASELLESDAAGFDAQPKNFPVLFSDYQRQLKLAPPLIKNWNTRLNSIMEQATNMAKLDLTGKEPQAKDSEYIQNARNEIGELLAKMEACDAFFQNRMAERSAITPIGKTLREYLVDATLAVETESAKALEAELQKLRAEESEKIRRIVLETEKAKLAAEKLMAEERLKAQAERLERERRELADSLAAENKAAEENEKITAEDRALKNDMSQIKKLLYQFTTKTHKQLKPDGYFELTSEPTAISLKALIAYGALTPGNEGNFKLKQAMGMMADKNDRPQPPINVFAFDHSNAIPVQNLLIKHGDAMVRAGLLAE
jgi:hypothetical protein